MQIVKYFLSLFVLIFSFACSTTQQVVKIPECDLLNENIRLLYVDAFKNLYIVNNKNRLNAYDPELNLLYTYFNNRFGTISSIDITNPKKILVFFKDFQQIIFLDNTLTDLYQLKREFNFNFDIRAVGSSRDNKVWIYDGLDYRLKKIDDKAQVLLSSNPVESYLNIKIDPNYIIEYNNEVFIVDEKNGIHIFDNFGNYLRSIFEKDIQSFQLFNNQMAYLKSGKIYLNPLNTKFSEPFQIDSIGSESDQFVLLSDELFYSKNGCLIKKDL